MKNLALRAVTGILFVVVVVASILLYPTTIVPFYMLITLVAIQGTREFLRMTGIITSRIPTLLTFVTVISVVILPALVSYLEPKFLVAILLMFFPVLSAVVLFQKNGGDSPLRPLSLCLVPLFWIAFPVMLMDTMIKDSVPLLLALFILIWLDDTLAYCAGSLFGRHKLCERISPKKTVEGFVIAFVLTVVASVAFGYIGYFADVQWNILQWVGFAVVVVLFGTLGDLAESMIKRACGVKDSGNILPGHGGVLDRFDSVLMAVPAGVLYTLIVG
ncbi:MAG: phosphatidate cytidylyltransferase [Bacteroidales bacterium]|nr:phosphatidate cytidylyltransferase [Bacteroidales bacterium]